MIKIKIKAPALSMVFGTESSPMEHIGLGHNKLHKKEKQTVHFFKIYYFLIEQSCSIALEYSDTINIDINVAQNV